MQLKKNREKLSPKQFGHITLDTIPLNFIILNSEK